MWKKTRLLIMGSTWALFAAGIASAATAIPGPAPVVVPLEAPVLPPSYVADLTTPAVMTALGGQWRNWDVKIVEVPAMANAGPAWKMTYDIDPKAGVAGFDDSAWPVIEPKELLERRGGGHFYMTWYRSKLTIPAKLGDFDPSGARVALNVLYDDYAEVWVNGVLPRATGRISPATIQGFNIPNRVMLSESVKPGDTFEIAILGINGPISVSPANPAFFRFARLEFFK
jgi:gluconolactonase